MNVRIVAVGRLKERFWKEAQAEYAKRLTRYHKLEVVEVADEPAPQAHRQGDQLRVLAAEGARVLSRLREDARLVALCLEGQQLTSPGLAQTLEQWALAGVSKVDFVIGGSLGLAGEVSRRAALQLSFSPMTFSHQMFRVMLLEQLYRAAKITAGEPYHK